MGDPTKHKAKRPPPDLKPPEIADVAPPTTRSHGTGNSLVDPQQQASANDAKPSGNALAALAVTDARRGPPPKRHATIPKPRDLSTRVRGSSGVVAHVTGGKHHHPAWREGAPPDRRGSPTAEKPHDLPYPPIKGPLPCEADIKEWLDWNVTADDTSKAWERVRRLSMIFRPLVSPYREALKARLRADSSKDELAHLFHTRLSTSSRQLLISLLDGPPKPLAVIDPASMPAFVDDVKPASIHIAPEPVFDPETIRAGQETPLVIDSVELAAATAAITISASLAPPSPVALVWSIRDATDHELLRQQTMWTGVTSDPLRTAFDAVGSYSLTISIVDSEGLLITSVSRNFAVIQSDLDQLRAKSDDELKWKWSELHHAIFTGELPAGMDRVTLQLKLSQIEWVASERKLEVREKVDQDLPVIKDTTQMLITLESGLVLAGSPEKIRLQLEDEIIRRGTFKVLFYLSDKSRMVDSLERDLPHYSPEEQTEITFAYRRMHWALDQAKAIAKYNEEYVGWFEATAWGLLAKILTTSAAGAASARKAYGIPEPGRVDSAEDQAAQVKARAEFVTVAAELAVAKEAAEQTREVVLANMYAHGGAEWLEVWEQAYLSDVELTKNSDGYTDPQLRAEAQQRVKTVDEQIAQGEAALKHYQALFLQRSQKYPILGAYRDAWSDDFKRITADNAVDQITSKAAAVDANIAKVRDRLHDHAYDLWKLDNVIQQTMAALHVAPETLQARAVTEKIADAEPWWHTALTWIGVGLALAAAPFTAGSSIAIAIEIAGLAVTGMQLADDIQEYRFGKAAAHTDLDTVRSLASAEPSLLPVVLDLVFVGVQLGTVIKAFRVASKLRRLASAAESAGSAEAKALTKELDALGKAKLGRNIGTEVADEAVRVTKAKPFEEELAKVLEGRPGATLDVKVRPLDDKAFVAATGSESGNAAVVFRRNAATGKLEPEILVREGADPRVVREEAAHIDQAADLSKSHLIDELDEAKLEKWSSLTHEERMKSVRAKLELELDAQKRVLADLRSKSVLTDAEALQLDSAWQNIDNLRAQFEDWAAIENAGKAADAPLLEKPPRLFSKTTTVESDALSIAAADEVEFVTKYRELHPSSRLSDTELIQRFKDGKKINPDTGFLHDPTRRAPRKPDVPADFHTDRAKQIATHKDPIPDKWQRMELSPQGAAERDARIAERDTARGARDDLLKAGDETAAAKQGAKVNEASRKIGDLHANEYMQKFHSDYERIYPPSGAASRSGDFDQVWRRYKMVDGEKQFLDEVYIIEAKGGAGKLGVRTVDGQVVEQGTSEYYQAIRENMKSIDETTYKALTASKKNTKYILVHSPIVSGDPSVANTILVDEFKVGTK